MKYCIHASFHVILLIYMLITSFHWAASACQIKACTEKYGSSINLEYRSSFNAGRPKESQVKDNCPSAFAYRDCVKSSSKSCRGDLYYQAVLQLIKRWIRRNSCRNGKKLRKKNPLKSGPSVMNPKIVYPDDKIFSEMNRLREERMREKCLTDGYNYGLHPNKFKELKGHFSSSTKTRRQYNEAETASRILTTGFKRRKLSKRDYDYLFDHLNDQMILPQIPDQISQLKSKEMDYNLGITLPLTCTAWGDPHIRTFTQQYQTCTSLGARPFINHPLFLIQITNSRIRGAKAQGAGITRVTVLIRSFSSCNIHRNILYEAQSSQSSLSSTFSDGRSSVSANSIRIVSHSESEVSLFLDHAKAEIRISQIDHESRMKKHLNVAVKFNESLSLEDQMYILHTLGNESMCKVGCPNSEQIDIQLIVRKTQAKSNYSGLNCNFKFSEMCGGLRDYYRISCLFDVCVKQLTTWSSASRFGQTHDQKASYVNLGKNIHIPGTSNANYIFHSLYKSLVIFLFTVILCTNGNIIFALSNALHL